MDTLTTVTCGINLGSTMSISSRRPPGTSQGGRSRPPPSSLACNACRKSIATTCFYVKCGCVFCEECTFAHFADSDQCPSCGKRPLKEVDFTEILVSEISLAPDLHKTLFQNIMSIRRNASTIPFPDMCASYIRQLESQQKVGVFLLKQMLKDCSSNSQMNKGHEALKQQVLDLKRQVSTFKDMIQRNTAEFSMKLRNKDKALEELQTQNKMMARELDAARNRTSSASNQVVPSSRYGQPPLQGILAQREAQAIAQQNAVMGARQVLGSRMTNRSNESDGRAAQTNGYSIQSPVPAHATCQYSHRNNGGPMRLQDSAVQRQMQQNITPMQIPRPLTNGSHGSGNRIREITASSGYNFTSAAMSGERINKRRRTTPINQTGRPFQASQMANTMGNPYHR